MVFEDYIANDYLRALAIFVVLLFLLRILASVLERGLLKLVKKTKTDLDDIIVKKSSIPITMILFFLSLRLAMNELILSAGLLHNINAYYYDIFGYVRNRYME